MEKKKEILPLKILLLLTVVLFGGFYEFVSCMVTIALGLYLLYFIIYRGKPMRLYRNGGLILSAVICVGCLGSLPFAVDRGMALIGLVKVLPLPLFALVLMQLSEEDREELLGSVPYSGALVVGFSVLFCWIPVVRDQLYLAGRLGGTFQYSNTMALYFLAGVLLSQGAKGVKKGTKHCLRWKNQVLSAILLLGILLSGSRSVFVLTAAVLLVLAWRRREYRRFNIAILAAALLLGGVYSFATGDYQNLGRFLTISLSNSTLIGRFLYWQDALPLVFTHPFGLGYMGYYYLQGSVQTGVYTTVFVHNDFLQLLLDFGWIPGIAAAAVFFRSLFSGKQDHTAKAVLAVIGLHSLFDFDMQFLSMGFLFLMVLEGYGTEENGTDLKPGSGRNPESGRNPASKNICIGITAAMAASLYFMIPLAASYTGDNELAGKIYPYYTEANLTLLGSAETREEGEKLADRILRTNQNAALAFDAKALSCAMDGDFDQMIAWKEQALYNNPYALYEYVDYVSLLSRGIEYFQQAGDQEKAEEYAQRIREIPERLEALEERTSAPGWMIRDLPETELPDDVSAYIKSL